MIFTINNQQFQCKQYSKSAGKTKQMKKINKKMIFLLQNQDQLQITAPFIFQLINKFSNLSFLLLLSYQTLSIVIKTHLSFSQSYIQFIIVLLVHIMKVKQFLTDHKDKIIIALGVAAAGALTYWLVKKFKGSDTTPNSTPIPFAQQPVSQGSISSDNSEKASQNDGPIAETYDSKFARVINEVRLVLDLHSQDITPQVIRRIIQGQYQLANEDIKSLILKTRRQRRSKFEDHLQYAKIVTKIQLQLEQIQQKHLGAILARFNIDKATWKDACAAWQMKQTQNEGQNKEEGFSDLIRQQQEKQLLSLRIPNSKPKQFIFIEQILKFRIKSLQVINPTQLGLDLAIDNAARYDMIEAFINDLVFKKFNIEEEDIEFSIQLLSKKDKEKVSEYEQKIGELMQRFLVEEEDDQQSNFY